MKWLNLVILLLFATTLSDNTLGQTLETPQTIPYFWVIDTNTENYEMVSELDTGQIRTDIKVIYDQKQNVVIATDNFGSSTILDMNTVPLYGKIHLYPDDMAAKYAMIAAELGGGALEGYEKALNEALIISASMDNRLHVDSLSRGKFVKSDMERVFGYGSYQSLFTPKQYNAMVYPAYYDFSYGYKRRTRNDFKRLIGLCVVWKALIDPVSQLHDRGMSEAHLILGYCHGGYLKLYRDRSLDFSMLETHTMKKIVTSDYLFSEEVSL